MHEGNITERQQLILKAIIQEYVETAQAVGSEDLVKSSHFGFSPATMRNEMAELTRMGFLQKDHVSAGRAPTPQAFRYFIKNLMDEKELPVVNEVAMKQRLWDNRQDVSLLLREAAHTLADESQNLAMVVTDDGKVYVAGMAHILRHPEFYDIDVTRSVLHLIDQYDLIRALVGQISPEVEMGIILGDEMVMRSMSLCGVVICRINLPNNHDGYITVVGPYRLDYPTVIPAVRYLQHTMNDMFRTW